MAGETRDTTCRSVEQAWALGVAVVRELMWGLSSVLREVRRWQALAAKIPDVTIRADALAALKQKRPNTDGAALFWTITTRRCPRLLRLLVAYEIMADFLDSTIERGAHAGVANGRQLHLALVDAVDTARPLSDYFRHHPWQDDGGYLPSLVVACRDGCATLPSYGTARPLMIRAAALAQVQGLNHELDLLLREAILQAWAELQTECGSEVGWYETAGAAAAWLTVLALMAVAAEPACHAEYFSDVYSTYFPWFSLTATLLDSYGDLVEDQVNEENSYISHYGSLEAAVQRIEEVVRRASFEAYLLRNGARHSVILAAMIAMYLSKDSAVTPAMKPMSRRLLHAAGPLAALLVPILRAWRVAYALKEA
jgi:tetraprenyl-beta-curcumene synthase